MTANDIVLLLACGGAAYEDARRRRIPNWVTIPALAAGLGLHAAGGGLKASALGLAVALAIGLPLFALRGLGGGDVKLLAAAGALTGWPAFGTLFLVNAALSGGVAIGLLVWRGGLGRALGNVGHILAALLRFRAPYADREELDVGSARAVTLPQGPIFLVAAVVYLVLRGR